jgi:protein FAM32A
LVNSHWSTMSDYDFRPGGSLKLKGKDGEGLKKYVSPCRRCSSRLTATCRKKKSSKSHDKSVADADKARERQRVKDMLLKDDTGPGSGSGSARDSPIPGGSGSRKTDAERRFEEAQRERVSINKAGLRSSYLY